MIEQRSETGLSTADMVAGMDRQNRDEAPATEAKRPDDGAVPTEQPAETDVVRNGATATATAPASGGQTSLLTEDKAAAFRARWDTIQASFVDEPRQSVEQADSLVAEAIKQLAEVFA
jgi:hypothetical protein